MVDVVGRLRRVARSALGLGQLSEWPSFPWHLFGLPVNYSKGAGVDVTQERAMRVATVMACVRVLAEGLACLPLFVYRRRKDGGKDKAAEIPLYTILRERPNQIQAGFNWLEMLVAHVALRGNAYCKIVEGEFGAVSELVPMAPDRMRVELLDNGRKRFKFTTLQGREEPYNQEQIFHVPGLAYNGLVGMNPIEYARETLKLAVSAEQHGSAMFGNGARPGVVFKSTETYKDDTREKLAKDWDAHQGGPENAGKTAFLPKGVEPVELGLTMEDAQFLETRKYQRSEICALFRVPPHMVGDLERATFSNIEQQSIDFVVNTLFPWCRRFESAFNSQLIDDPDLFVEFRIDGRMRGDATARKEFYTAMYGIGVFSTNDIRELENLNPIGPDGDKRFVAVNLTTIDQAGKPQEPKPLPLSAPDEKPEPKPGDESPRGLEASLRVLRENVTKLIKWEISAAQRAAGKPEKFLSAVEAFYAEHGPRMTAALANVAEVVNCLALEPIDLAAAIAAHVEESRERLLAASECVAAELAAAVERETETWPDRAAQFGAVAAAT